jgi:hypothetical protein
MYTLYNYRTKKELKAAFDSGEKITICHPSLPYYSTSGREVIEGPHFPKPHTWYQKVEVVDNVIVKLVK